MKESPQPGDGSAFDAAELYGALADRLVNVAISGRL